MRSPSIFSDWSGRPSFFRTTPAKKPPTENCCQLVAFMIAAIVAPLGWLSSAITVACLEFERGVGVRAIVVSWVLLAGRLPAERALTFLMALLFGMLGSFFGDRRHPGPSHHRSPAVAYAGGAGFRAVKTRASST